MPYCSVKWCGINNMTEDYKKHNMNFHRFPNTPNLKRRWVEAVRLRKDTWYPTYTSVICSRHFKNDCYYMTNGRRRLRDNSVPTENLVITEMPRRKNKSKARQHRYRLHLAEMNEIPIREKLEGQVIISNVFYYLEREYISLKPYFNNCDMTPLADILRRTAEATGASKRTVLAILKNERIEREKKRIAYLNPEKCLLDHDYEKPEKMHVPVELKPDSNPPQSEVLVDKQNEMQFVIMTYNPPEETAPLDDKFVFDTDVEAEDITVEPDITELCLPSPVENVVQDTAPCPECNVDIKQTEDSEPVEIHNDQDRQTLDESDSVQLLLTAASAMPVKKQLPEEKSNEKLKSTYPRIDVIIDRLQRLDTSVRRPVRKRMPIKRPNNKLKKTDSIVQQIKPLDTSIRADKIPSELNPDRMSSELNPDRMPSELNPDKMPSELNPNKMPSDFNCDRVPSKSPKDKLNEIDKRLKPLDTNVRRDMMELKLPDDSFNETDNIIERLKSLDTSVCSEEMQSELDHDRMNSELMNYRIPTELPNEKLNDLEKIIHRLLSLQTSVRMQSNYVPKDEINDIDYIQRRLKLMDTSIKAVILPKKKLNEVGKSIQRVKPRWSRSEIRPKPPEENVIEVSDAIKKLKYLSTSVEIKTKSCENISKHQYNPGEDSREGNSNKRDEPIQPLNKVDKDQGCQEKDTMNDAIRRLQSLATTVEIKAEILDQHLNKKSGPDKNPAQEKVSYKCDVQIKTMKATTEKNCEEKTNDAIRRLQSLSSIEFRTEQPDGNYVNYDDVSIGETVWEPDGTSLDEYQPRGEFSDYYRNFM